MTIKALILAMFLIGYSQLSTAGRLINDMQSCQALIEFIGSKLDASPAGYSESAMGKVRKGLNGYNQYIQTEIVTPGLLKFNGGDKTKASDMQKQVDDYKQSVLKAYETRYPKNTLLMDHAIALNNCAKKAVPKGQALDNLKAALQSIVELSKIK